MNYRLLLLNHDPIIASLITDKLKQKSLHGYSLTQHDPQQESYKIPLAARHFDACLLDESTIDIMPAATLDAIARILPVILVSHLIHKRRPPKSIADVVLSHTFSADVLDRSLRYITEQKKYIRQLKALTLYDTLTQLPNRNHFQHKLASKIAKHSRNRTGFSLLIIDLDRFKYINASFGHDVGDNMLVHISKTLKKSLQPNDLAARLGNNEFAVLFINDDTNQQAQQLNESLSNTVECDGRTIRINASIGVSRFPQDGNTISQLMGTADYAMQEAKKRGGGSVCFYNATQQKKLGLSWVEAEFHHALAEQQLFLEYQPLVSSSSGECVKLEALCRWHHPEKGLILPDTFIPVIEKTPMIAEMGRWVLKTVCNELARLQNQWPTLKIAVNISMMQVCRTRFIEDVRSILATTGVNPEQLELELTESALMMDPLQSISTLAKLRELDIHIAIDDFGTGHSSLSYLVDLPIDILKIDRRFIYDFIHHRKRESIVKAIIAMAKSLNITTVAEGVEDQQTANYLSTLGCDLLQGYHISHPTSLQQILTHFRREAAH